MQTVLNDIELDVAELKCLLQAFEASHDPKLALAARRNIGHMKQRLDQLQALLDKGKPASASAPTFTPEPETPAHAEEKAGALPREAGHSSSESTATPAALPETPETDTADNATLGERIRPAKDLRHALSLNDSFRFARELFRGDTARLNDLLARLAEAGTWDEALTLFTNERSASEDNPALAEFEELLKKYFDR